MNVRITYVQKCKRMQVESFTTTRDVEKIYIFAIIINQGEINIIYNIYI